MVFKKGDRTWKKRRSYKGKNNPFYGKHHTEDAKIKISESHKDQHPTEKTRKKMSEHREGKNNAFYGKHHTDKTKKVLSKKIAMLHKSGKLNGFKEGNIPYNDGVPMPQKTKDKIIASWKEKIDSGYETCYVEGHPGWSKGLTKETDERVMRISNAHRGKHYSKDTEFDLDTEFLEEYGTTRTFYPYNMVFNNKFKDMIRARDGNKCAVTGMTNEEHKAKYGRSLTVHHWTYDKDETNPFYFVTVTCGVNIAAETNRGEWIDMFNGIMEDKYCELMV